MIQEQQEKHSSPYPLTPKGFSQSNSRQYVSLFCQQKLLLLAAKGLPGAFMLAAGDDAGFSRAGRQLQNFLSLAKRFCLHNKVIFARDLAMNFRLHIRQQAPQLHISA